MRSGTYFGNDTAPSGTVSSGKKGNSVTLISKYVFYLNEQLNPQDLKQNRTILIRGSHQAHLPQEDLAKGQRKSPEKLQKFKEYQKNTEKLPHPHSSLVFPWFSLGFLRPNAPLMPCWLNSLFADQCEGNFQETRKPIKSLML